MPQMLSRYAVPQADTLCTNGSSTETATMTCYKSNQKLSVHKTWHNIQGSAQILELVGIHNDLQMTSQEVNVLTDPLQSL